MQKFGPVPGLADMVDMDLTFALSLVVDVDEKVVRVLDGTRFPFLHLEMLILKTHLAGLLLPQIRLLRIY